jgi:hypothetical protein
MPATLAILRAKADYNTLPLSSMAQAGSASAFGHGWHAILQIFQGDNRFFPATGGIRLNSGTRSLPYDEAGRVPFGLALSTAFGSACART